MVVKGTIVAGHGVASGQGGDSRYPGGTLRMQMPYFLEYGIDLSSYHIGTINVALGEKKIQVLAPKFKVINFAWSSHIPPENFFFFDVQAIFEGRACIGLIYMPDPATKTDHFQDSAVLELLLPFIPGIKSGKSISLRVDDAQIKIQ